MNKKVNKVIAAILIILVIIGTIWDYSISQTLYNPDSVFANFIYRFGNLYTLLICPFFCIFAFMATRKSGPVWRNTLTTTLQWIFIIGLSGVGLVYYPAVMLNDGNLNLLRILWFTVLAVVIVFCLYRITHWIAQENRTELRRYAIALLIAIIVAILAVEIIKELWGRPRFYTVYDGLAEFQPWYRYQGVAASDLFKSFPSGHACESALIFGIIYLPLMDRRLEKYCTLFYIVGCGWPACVMLARVIAGAHHLTDVAMGALLTLFCYEVIAMGIVRKMKNKNSHEEDDVEVSKAA